MDLGAIVGILAGIGLIIGSILLGSGLLIFWSASSAMIVIGGTMAAISIAFPFKDLKVIPKLLGQIFKASKHDPEKLVDQLVELSKKLKKGSLLEMPKIVKQEMNIDFLVKGIDLIVAGVNIDTVEYTLVTEKINAQKRHSIGADVFLKMSSFAPAFGMVGTLIGLVQMLAGLDDPSTIGPKMAVALLTTFYGAVLANLFFIPLAQKLKRKNEIDTVVMDLCTVLITSIKDDAISLIKDKLNAYVQANAKKGDDKKK